VGRRRDGLHFGVGRDVVQPLGKVVAAGNHPVLPDDYGADGHFILVHGLDGFLDGKAHEAHVVFGRG